MPVWRTTLILALVVVGTGVAQTRADLLGESLRSPAATRVFIGPATELIMSRGAEERIHLPRGEMLQVRYSGSKPELPRASCSSPARRCAPGWATKVRSRDDRRRKLCTAGAGREGGDAGLEP